MDATPDPADILDDLEELSSAEEFLDYFGIAFDPNVVHVNRLHILQRFHDYLDANGASSTTPDFRLYRRFLAAAYADFVNSDAQTEKVFRVFHMHEPKTTFVPLSEIFH